MTKFRAMFVKLFTIFFISLLFQSLKSSSKVLDFTYNGFPNSLQTNISVQGMATVTPNGLLKLTNKTKQQSGHAFYTRPIRFKDSPNATVSSFSTTFVFGIYPETPTLGGHGMAFVVTPNPSLPFSSPGEYLGIFNVHNDGNDTNHVFAVELDTIRSLEFNDTDDNHVGINLNSLKSVNSSPAGYWDEKDQFNNLTLISRKRMQVWVDYDSPTHRIDVTMASFQKDKPRKPLVSVVKDLSSVLLQDMFVGFSSATGSVLSEYYVLGWSFRVKRDAPMLTLSKLPKLPGFRKLRINNLYEKWVPFVALFFFFLLLVLLRWILKRRRKFAEELEDWEKEFVKSRLKYKDLYYATKGFNEKHLIGSGGFGNVYRGVMLKTDKEIAVKRISNESRQGLKEFVSEIISNGRMSHRNLVPLLGYCRRRNELLLVYDYMPNGSLDKYLHNSPEVTLNWEQRFKVIYSVASALFYLHEEWEQVVVHRDIKASNILLDADYNGRLGDFGLARMCGHGREPKTTNFAGTRGYLAPELIKTGRATTATDIFAFGVLLLEVACGRRPIHQIESGQRIVLVNWVFDFWMEGKIMDARDPNIESEHDQREVEMVLKLGLFCTHPNPQARPTMRYVIHYLKGDATLPDLSPSKFREGGVMLGIHHDLSESAMFTGASLMVDSVLSGPR